MAEMVVRVRLFAGLRADAGWSQQEVALAAGATLADLLVHLEAVWPGLRLTGRPVYAAVNQQYVQRSHPLAPGDEVALFPPVSGGQDRVATPVQNLLQAIAQGDDSATEARVLALSGTDGTALLALAGDPDPERRWWGVRALAQVGGAEAVAPVVAALAAPDAGERAVAALALGHLHTRAPQAVNPHLSRLAACLADEAGLVRQAAADGLALCGEAAVPVLVAALDSEHDGVRVRAAAALRKVHSLQSAAALFPRLNDPNHLVRLYAYETLDALGLLTNILLRR